MKIFSLTDQYLRANSFCECVPASLQDECLQIFLKNQIHCSQNILRSPKIFSILPNLHASSDLHFFVCVTFVQDFSPNRSDRCTHQLVSLLIFYCLHEIPVHPCMQKFFCRFLLCELHGCTIFCCRQHNHTFRKNVRI